MNDESVVNSHGFVLLNAAGRFERFNANPVMLFNHESDKLIGQMTGVRIEGTKLVGTPTFDEEDALASKCKRQGEKGILKGCSPGIIMHAVELRTTPEGEERITVTDWTLCEVSLVSVPSNQNALRLYNMTGEAIPDNQIKLSVESLLNNHKKMDKIILTAEAYAALGLKSAEADGKDISAAIMELKARAEKAEKTVDDARKEKATALVELAVKDGRITADKKDQFVKLALADFTMAKETLEAIPAKVSLSGQITPAGKVSVSKERDNWTYLEWAKKDPEGLKQLKENDPEAFAELKKRIN